MLGLAHIKSCKILFGLGIGGIERTCSQPAHRCCCDQRACGTRRRFTVKSDPDSHPGCFWHAWTGLSSPMSDTISHHLPAAQFALASLVVRGLDE